MLDTRVNAHNRTKAAARRQSDLRYGDRLLIQSTEFPPTRTASIAVFNCGAERGEKAGERGEPRIRSTLSRGPERPWGVLARL